MQRKSRLLVITLMPAGTVTAFNAGALRELARVPSTLRLRITTDNGWEFAGYAELAGQLGFKTYFADPSSAWRRGTSENTTALVRQYFPKGHDFSTTTANQVSAVGRKLNNRPRKCLASKTSNEVFTPSPGRLLRLKSQFTLCVRD